MANKKLVFGWPKSGEMFGSFGKIEQSWRRLHFLIPGFDDLLPAKN